MKKSHKERERELAAKKNLSDAEKREQRILVEAHKSKRNRNLRKLMWVLFLIPVIYIIIQLFIIMIPSSTKTSLVLNNTMTDSITTPGFVSFSRTDVTVEEGVLSYAVTSGDRVKQGQQVIDIYADTQAAQAKLLADRANKSILQLEQAQAQAAENQDDSSLEARLTKGTQDVIAVLQSDNYSELTDKTDVVEEILNETAIISGENVDFSAQMEELKTKKASYEAVAKVKQTVQAPATGYFVSASKNDRKIPAYTELQAYSPIQLQEEIEKEPTYKDSNVKGYIIDSYTWHFVASAPIKAKEKLTKGTKLDISFAENTNIKVPVEVIEVKEDAEQGIMLVNLECDRVDTSILSLQYEKATLIFNTYDGLRVDKKALRVKDGVTGVYVKFGGIASYKPVTVLAEDENYALVSSTYTSGENELQLYDEVIIEGEDVKDGTLVR